MLFNVTALSGVRYDCVKHASSSLCCLRCFKVVLFTLHQVMSCLPSCVCSNLFDRQHGYYLFCTV